MKRAVLLAVLVLVGTSCDSARVDPMDEFASASCAAVQSWVDAVEDLGTDLSNAVIKIDSPGARRPYYLAFTSAIHERADDTIRQLRHIAPTEGEGVDAAQTFIAAMRQSERVTTELEAVARSFPTGDVDTEDVYSRVAMLFVGNEKAFSYPSQALDQLAARYPAFANAPSCRDYDDPVT